MPSFGSGSTLAQTSSSALSNMKYFNIRYGYGTWGLAVRPRVAVRRKGTRTVGDLGTWGLRDLDIDKTESSLRHSVTPSPRLSLTRVVALHHPVTSNTPSLRHSNYPVT